MSNCIADMALNVFPVGNIVVKGGMVCMVASSFTASLQLTNDHVLPVSNIASTVNPWVCINKYKSPHCILTLLKCDSSNFPTYLIFAGYISFPAPSRSSCLYYLASPLITRCWFLVRSSLVVLRLIWCIWTVFGYMSSLYTILAHWSSMLTNIL